jgi:hypothetical protein
MKMEATFSSETSVDFQRTTQHYIPEDRSILMLIVHTDITVVGAYRFFPLFLWLHC